MYSNQIPAPQQTTKVKNDLNRLAGEDTIQYKPFNGGNPRMLKVQRIFAHKTDPNHPRLFVGIHQGKEVRVFENQVVRVIFKSHEEYADLKLSA